MATDKLAPYEATLSVTTTEQELVIDGFADSGMLGTWVSMLSHDEGKAAGATIQDLQFQVIPKEQADLYGGRQWQTPYGSIMSDGNGGLIARPNGLRLGFMLRPNEKLSIFYKSKGTAGPTNVQLRIERIKCFDPKWRTLLS